MDPESVRLRLSQRARRTAEPPIHFLMEQAVGNPRLISLAAGLVDHETLPVEATRATLDELLGDGDGARRALQYGTTQGCERLRERAVAHLGRLEGCSARELGVSAQDVLLTTGSQQLLGLIGELLIDPGDIVIVGAPDYFVYLGTLAALGARPIAVPLDEQGMIPEALDEALERLERAGELERVKLAYCGSYFQNPTGVTLAAGRRPVISDILARRSRGAAIFLLEDAAYRELCYGALPPRSLWAQQRERDAVILTQTFSKSYSPGLRVGYSVVPRSLMAPLLRQKAVQDFGSANFNQHLLAAMMESGRYDEHVARLKSVYRCKLDAMQRALEREFGRLPVRAQWTRPDGGLYVWLNLPDGPETTQAGPLFRRAIAHGVLYVPGEHCFPAGWQGETLGLGGPRHTARLSFGTASAENIAAGVARLAAALCECLGAGG